MAFIFISFFDDVRLSKQPRILFDGYYISAAENANSLASNLDILVLVFHEAAVVSFNIIYLP